MKHLEDSIIIHASGKEIFAYIDHHKQFSSHMSKSNWMLGGGKMDASVDEGRGQRVGSHIRLQGKAFGISLFLDEVVTQYEPPVKKHGKLLALQNF